MRRFHAPPWDPLFAKRSPVFTPLTALLDALDLSCFPSMPQVQRLLDDHAIATHNGARLRLVACTSRRDVQRDYERRVYETAEMEHREESWHDFFNALVWIAFPRAKAALNARHIQEMANELNGRRGSVRDALTAFDEDGIVVVSAQPHLLQLLRGFHWKDVLWGRRTEVQRWMRWFVFGHAQYEKALEPFVGLTAKALMFEVDQMFLDMPLRAQLDVIDERIGQALVNPHRLLSPRELAPIPLLGIPDWFAASRQEAFYEDSNYFRPGRPCRAR